MNDAKPAASPLVTPTRLAFAGAIALGALAVYGALRPAGNETGICAASVPLAARLAPLARGEFAALAVRAKPSQLADLVFDAPDGSRKTLSAFAGKTVLINLWATWCAPCRAEMPALDALQAELGGADFEVVAINIDTRNLDRPGRFLDEIGVKRLVRYADPSAGVFQTLKSAGRAIGMPTTILIDKQRCELATLGGPAEWSGPAAIALIRTALGR